MNGPLGALIGSITALMTKFTHIKDFPLLETSLFFLMSYSSYLLAEICEMSGIVSILFCGIFQVLMCGSCHFDRLLNAKFGVEYQMIFVALIFNCSFEIQFGAPSRFRKGWVISLQNLHSDSLGFLTQKKTKKGNKYCFSSYKTHRYYFFFMAFHSKVAVHKANNGQKT